VRGQLEPQPTYVSYDQDTWMDLQNYAARDWSELLTLWYAYNRHLLHLMRTVKIEALEHGFQNQNFTLEFLMRDYIRHCEHHLAQILLASQG